MNRMQSTRIYNAIISMCAALVLMFAGPAKSLESVTLESLASLYAAGGEVPLVDVRTPQEYNLIHFKGAKNIPIENVEARLEEFKGKSWIIYCRTGNRARQAADVLTRNGINDFRLVQGGIADLPLFLKKLNQTNPQTVQTLQKNIEVTVPAVGFRLPHFAVSTNQGMTVSPVTDSAGRVLLVLFWSPEDPVSEEFLSDSMNFSAANKDVVLVPIPLGNSDPIIVKKSLDAVKYKGPIYVDPLGETAQFLKIDAAPLFLLVDKEGILRSATASGLSQTMPAQGDLSIRDLAADAMAEKPMRFPDSGLYAEEADPAELKDKKAPPFALRDAHGRLFSLEDNLNKKPAVVIFFSLGCPYSRKELEALAAYDAQYAGVKQYQILAVTKDSGPQYREQVEQFMSSNGIVYPVIYDPTGDVMFQYRVSGVPEWVVVDKSGIIRLVNVGYAENTEVILNSFLQ